MSSSLPTRTLDSILEEADAPVPIDLLSIDVEGHETEVLRGFDFSRWQPLLILVEDHVNNLQTHRYLKRSGYRLIRRLGHNGWYVPAGEARDGFVVRALGNPAQILSCAAVPCGAQCLAPGPAALRRLVGGTLDMPRLSAIIIALNEAGNIADCLDTLSFCDERIVVDGGSTDATAQIAQGKGARVVSHPFEGFGAQKGFALSLATGDWVLSIDADERVSAGAGAGNSAMRSRPARADAYEMPRRSSFCGRLMDQSGWSPDYVLRLFRRDKAYFSGDLVHERVVCDGTVARLKEPLMHDPVRRLEDALSRMDRYSTRGRGAASRRRASGSRSCRGFPTGCGRSCAPIVLRAGFLDGREGFLLAVANAEGTYYRYMKAWLKGRAAVSGLISVVVTTYNREDALDAVLRSLAARATATSRCWSPTTARARRPRRWSSNGSRGSACRSPMSGTSIAAFAPAKSATARSAHRAATMSCFSTAIAWRGRISSRTHAGLPSPAGSSPAIARC